MNLKDSLLIFVFSKNSKFARFWVCLAATFHEKSWTFSLFSLYINMIFSHILQEKSRESALNSRKKWSLIIYITHEFLDFWVWLSTESSYFFLKNSYSWKHPVNCFPNERDPMTKRRNGHTLLIPIWEEFGSVWITKLLFVISDKVPSRSDTELGEKELKLN